MARIAILLEQKYEDLELQYPRLRLIEAGHQVEVIAPKLGEKYLGKWGYPQAADKPSKESHARDYQLIVIPGGMSIWCGWCARRRPRRFPWRPSATGRGCCALPMRCAGGAARRFLRSRMM